MAVAVLELERFPKIELLSWAWGPVSMGSGYSLPPTKLRPGGAFADRMVCSKTLDLASTMLMNHLGRRISTGTLTAVGSDLVVLTLTGIVITSWRTSGDNVNPLEAFELRFDGLTSKYAHLANGPLGFLTTGRSTTTAPD